jgi:crotonobetainyl-CoA:carnitine CoA-transferase CaiB-like acyl-CoA transferase
MMKGPTPMTMLDGIRIIDMTSVIFGPYATQMLADLGADVIKVEPPIGDVSRYLGRAKKERSNGSVHLTVNRGKRSIVLDLKKPDDAEVMRGLIRTADIFIHNVRGKAIARLGFGPDDCIALKPDLIYVHCTGFGQDGPYRDLQAYDDVIQAASGAVSLAPRVDGNPRPRYIPSLIADKLSGTYAAQAMLAALVHKLRTGEGQQVEVPMFEAFTNFMLEEHMCDAATIPPIGPIGYPRQLDPNRQPFPTADGYISIVPYSDAKVVGLFALLGAPGWFAEMGLDDALARAMNMSRIYAKIAELTPARPTAEWMALFTTHQIAAMPVRDLADVFEDPHLVATGFFRTREHPVEGPYREMRPPVRYSADSNRVLGIAPDLGQHGAEIREELRRHADKG